MSGGRRFEEGITLEQSASAAVKDTAHIQPSTDTAASHADADAHNGEQPFPWHIGVCDSHCHPTDSMQAIREELGSMKARVLTIMATRFQDQDLVAQVAKEHPCNTDSNNKNEETGITKNGNSATPTPPTGPQIIPSFGYHPWFSHLIYDDTQVDPSDETQPPLPDKTAHYNAVLTSTPITADLASSLPSPTPLSQILAQTRANLEAHPHALLGEVGLDRAFRIPHGRTALPTANSSTHSTTDTNTDRDTTTPSLTPGTHHSHPLTKHRVKPQHQVALLQAQLRLAGEYQRAASIHVVGGQGLAFDALRALWRGYEVEVLSARQRKKLLEHEEEQQGEQDDEGDDEEEGERTKPQPKPFPPRICLHSFSGPPETVAQYMHPSIPVEFYFSFSEAVNFSLPLHQQLHQKQQQQQQTQQQQQQHSKNNKEGQGQADATEEEVELEQEPALLRALAALKAVPEDRLLVESDLHTCGGGQMDALLEGIVRRVCAARGWGLDDGVRRLRRNWERFVFGVDSAGGMG